MVLSPGPSDGAQLSVLDGGVGTDAPGGVPVATLSSAR
jgi:hypothetical protein